ncbi:tRNA pseudouridine(38-40) synthase TruA [Halomarina pelagica]|uniref:tRNA pseudouridine(38-40) synthase TruA n=1 Tax=Halomarina pelagica TaxID=2961599 RepID=UPI0020C2D515|nr:tRNA pseudouridine(38-40) synthase TruA [Halomarina sp. BND7]
MRAFRIAYDGTSYFGYQRQPDVPTVEGELFAALARLGVHDTDDSRPAGYAAAGRTDAGVSAVAQTVALDAPEWLTPRALNGELPADVRAWASADAPADFHARHDATRRGYAYHLHAPDANVERASRVLDRLSGTHDFHNLTPDDEGTRRTLDAALDVEGPYLVVRVESPGFARQLVRRIVGLVADVARGEREVAVVDRALSGEVLSGPEGVAPAPPEPLVLTRVTYPDLDFVVDERAAESVEGVFEARRVERLTGARVAATVLEGVSGGPRRSDDEIV